MQIIDPGHQYTLDCLDLPGPPNFVLLTFVKRSGEGYPGNVGQHSGTTTQEVLRALIDRTKYVNNQIPDLHNLFVLQNLRKSIFELEKRAAERHGRILPVFRMVDIEHQSVCEECGHIGCKGACRG